MKSLLRVIDANLNRSREGLRVCEDLARLVMNHPKFSKSLKQLRHDINTASMKMPFRLKDLTVARDSAHDIGKKSSIRDERVMSWKSLMKSNLKRAEESLRVLEECSKIVSPATVKVFQKVRFEVYELEKQIIKEI